MTATNDSLAFPEVEAKIARMRAALEQGRQEGIEMGLQKGLAQARRELLQLATQLAPEIVDELRNVESLAEMRERIAGALK